MTLSAASDAVANGHRFVVVGGVPRPSAGRLGLLLCHGAPGAPDAVLDGSDLAVLFESFGVLLPPAEADLVAWLAMRVGPEAHLHLLDGWRLCSGSCPLTYLAAGRARRSNARLCQPESRPFLANCGTLSANPAELMRVQCCAAIEPITPTVQPFQLQRTRRLSCRRRNNSSRDRSDEFRSDERLHRRKGAK